MERMKLQTAVVDKLSGQVFDCRSRMFILPRSSFVSYEEMRDEQAKAGIADDAAYWVDYMRREELPFENFCLLSSIAGIVRSDIFDPVLAAVPL
jgi:hypothetical protein